METVVYNQEVKSDSDLYWLFDLAFWKCVEGEDLVISPLSFNKYGRDYLQVLNGINVNDAREFWIKDDSLTKDLPDSVFHQHLFVKMLGKDAFRVEWCNSALLCM